MLPPTEAPVRRMLDTVDRRPEEVVGLVAPRFGEATVENLAVHAVLAGCLPAYVPLVLAAIEAAITCSGLNSTTAGLQATIQ